MIFGEIFLLTFFFFFQIFGKRGKRREREKEREIFEYAKADLDKTFFLSFFKIFTDIEGIFFTYKASIFWFGFLKPQNPKVYMAVFDTDPIF